MSVPSDYSPNQIQTLNKLIGASTFITFGTTLVVTFLISYRIHSTSKQNLPRGGSRLRFKHILEILIQSAAIYSLAAAASATATIIPLPLESNGALRVLTAQVYTSSFYAFIAVSVNILQLHLRPSNLLLPRRVLPQRLWSLGLRLQLT